MPLDTEDPKLKKFRQREAEIAAEDAGKKTRQHSATRKLSLKSFRQRMEEKAAEDIRKEMQQPTTTRKRRVKTPRHIRRRLVEHATKDCNLTTSSPKPWISPDEVYCNTAYAAAYIGRSVSRLQSMRCEGKGPDYIKTNKSVYYRLVDLRAFIETGATVSK